MVELSLTPGQELLIGAHSVAIIVIIIIIVIVLSVIALSDIIISFAQG